MMIKHLVPLVLQSLQLMILTTAATFNYLNLRDIRRKVDAYMDTISTKTSLSNDYPISRCEHFYLIDPKEPHVIPLPEEK